MIKFIIMFLIVIIILSLLGIYYKILYNRLQKNKIKIDEAEIIINNHLKNRYDYIVRTSHLIKNKIDLDIEIFNEIENMKTKKVSNMELDTKINEAYNTIIQLKEDYPKLEENRGFKDIINDFNESNEILEAAKSFYDKYATILNELLDSFPSNIIGKIHKINKVVLYNISYINNDITD